jgi:hypothetical protein
MVLTKHFGRQLERSRASASTRVEIGRAGAAVAARRRAGARSALDVPWVPWFFGQVPYTYTISYNSNVINLGAEHSLSGAWFTPDGSSGSPRAAGRARA